MQKGGALFLCIDLPSLKLTQPLKMDGWNTSFLLGWPIFRGYVSFKGCIYIYMGISAYITIDFLFESGFHDIQIHNPKENA